MRKILIVSLLCLFTVGCVGGYGIKPGPAPESMAPKSTSCEHCACETKAKNCCDNCPTCKEGGCFCEPGKCVCKCCRKSKTCNTPGCTCPPDAPCSKSGCMDCKHCGACGTGCSPTCKGCKE